MIQTAINPTKRKIALLAVALLLVAMVLPSLTLSQVHAGQIVDRSLTLIEQGPIDDSDGGSSPSGLVNHLFEFTVESQQNVGSIAFEYCTTAAAVPDGIDCEAPDGLDVAAADLTTEDGVSGFSIDSAVDNEVVIARGSASNIDSDEEIGLQLDNITNPENPNETFFVRISAHESLDGTGSAVYFGTVAASTTQDIELDGTMPESLVFCTGETIDLTGGVPDCTTATSGNVSFDQLFSATDTATATSQMAATTNAGDGYAITVNGPTLTSGDNEIDPMDDGAGGATGIVLGSSQFGMNLVENDTTTDVSDDPLGLDVDPEPNQDNYRGQPAENYDTEDLFKFESGNVVANSYDVEPSPTDSQIFTKSYIVNVPGSQPAGTYTSTLTYVATATF